MKRGVIKKLIIALIVIIVSFVIWTLTIFIIFDVEKMQVDIESNYSTSLLDANGELMGVFK